MPSERTRRFVDALHALEAPAAELDPLVAMFAPEAELASLTATERGEDGARRFWSRYRAQFADAQSEFSRIIEAGDDAVLLWLTRGSLRTGTPIAYRGVSVLTFASDRIVRFETCYDSAAFVQPAARAGEAAA